MTDPADPMLTGIDQPRPLPAPLRARLEEQLLQAAAPEPLALGEELDERLQAALSDPLAAALAGIDAPRPLSPQVRARLQQRLRHAPRRAQALLGAAAAVVVLFGLLVAVVGQHGGPEAVRTPATTGPTVAGGSALGGAGAVGAGSVGGGAATGAAAGGTAADSAVAPVAGTGGAATAEVPPGAMAAEAPGPQAAVTVTRHAPDAGPLAGGTTVRLSGHGLAGTVGVWFGDHPAASYDVVSDSLVTAVTPAVGAPAVVDVVLHLRGAVTYRLNSAFSYLARPTVSAVTPSSGSTNGGVWVSVQGTALTRATAVSFGGTAAAQIEVVSDSRVRALSPAHLPGPVDVTVATPGGTSATTSGDRFTYLP